MNTMQQEFDAVVAHLYKQGRPSKDKSHCLYRNSEGLSCAVGCRIPDAIYVEGMDYSPGVASTTVKSLVSRYRSALPEEIVEYEYMFSNLQAAHDNCQCTDDGEFDLPSLAYELITVANTFGLTFTPPQQGE